MVTKSRATILLADDDAAIRTVLTQYLEQLGYGVRATDSGSTFWKWVESGAGDVAVSDVVMPDADGLDLLPRVKEVRPDLPVIIMSAKNTVLTALQASERGAFEYLPKPFDLGDLADAVSKALELKISQNSSPDTSADMNLPIVGSSSAMQAVYRLIGKVAPTDLSVLIRGESGTGKELVAKVLHEFGPRRSKPFVALNMAAIPADLVESELFGHEKGAFTGADFRKDGRFSQAEGGTLFLDEIGDMPLTIQTRLLRILQEGKYTRVGGLRELNADVRIIAATHRDLEAMVSEGSFREDLFYRLNVVPLHLPPLRERLADLAELVPALVTGLSSPTIPPKRFTKDAIDALRQHSWPGNVRELENFLQRVMAVLPQAVVDASAVQSELGAVNGPGHIFEDPFLAPQDLEHILQTQMQRFFSENRDGVPNGKIYTHFLEILERPLIKQTLRTTRGNQIQAAAMLGLNRNTLRKKVQELGIKVVRGHGTYIDDGS